MKTRKYFSYITLILALVLAFSLCSCQREQEVDISREIKEKIDNKIDAYKTDLMDSQDSLKTNKKIERYLMNWADAKGIRTKTDGDILIMNIDSSEEYQDAKKTIIICPYDSREFLSTTNTVALTQYVLKNNENTGALTALFVPEAGHDLKAFDKIDKKYLSKKNNVICLNGNVNGLVAGATGASAMYKFTSRMKTVAPNYTNAYHVRISGLTSSQSDNKINSRINPLTEINSLLASLKNSNIDFELISFQGGHDDALIPGSASVKFVIGSDKKERFESRLESKKESFIKKAIRTDKEARFDYREIKMPSRVIDQKDSYKFVSFVYTLLKGEYYRDEETDELIAVTSLPHIDLKGKKALITSVAYSLDDEILSEIDESENTLAGLSGFKYRKKHIGKVWEIDENSELLAKISDAYDEYTGKSLKTKMSVTPTAANMISGKNSCDIISITVSETTLKDFTGTIMHYLIDSNKTEE